MAFTRIVALAAAAVFAMGSSALAGPKVIDSISPQDLAALFNAHGYKAVVRGGTPSDPHLHVAFPKKEGNFEVMMHGCKAISGKTECDLIAYGDIWETKTPVSLKEVNAYNARWMLGKVFNMPQASRGIKKGAFLVTYNVPLVGGVTEGYLLASLDIWKRALEQLEAHIKPWDR